jgi:filamentous hemagglutinin family protein
VGGNLFHSFGLFNVNTGERATFTGPNSVENVLGRITGGSSSTIDGLLRSEIPGANLFLINPAGIMFGPNAQLDAQGSFHASTADFVRLGENGRFDAVEPDNSVLTVAPPSAFGFLGENPASIFVQGSSLNIPERETLSIVGGDIQIVGGNLSAPDGRINIASVSSPGEVVPDVPEQFGDLNVDSFDELGTIKASEGTTINVVGEGEGIFIRAGSFTLEDASQLSSSTEDFGAGQGATISVVADTVELKSGAQIKSSTGFYSTGQGGVISVKVGKMLIDSNAKIISETSFSSSSQGGAISVSVNELTLRDGAQIDSMNWGEGRGGRITINAKDTILITGSDDKFTGFMSDSNSDNPGMISITASDLRMARRGIIGGTSSLGGNNADIFINVKNLTLESKAKIITSTFSAPSGGSITIDAAGFLRIDGGFIQSNNLNTANADSKAGDITIMAKDIVMTGDFSNPATIFSVTNAKGKGGNIKVTAKDSISISGDGGIAANSVNLFNENPSNFGDAGKILISVPTLIMDGDVLISTGTITDGNAGKIQVNVDNLKLINGAFIDSTSGVSDGFGGLIVGKGQAGAVTVNATDSIFISGISSSIWGNPSGIFTQDAGVTNQPDERGMGNIRVITPQLVMDNKGVIRADTVGDRTAGEIIVNTKELKLTGGARISSDSGADVKGDLFIGNGGGGSLNITSSSLFVSGKDSIISTNTLGSGQGGDIRIKASLITLDDGATISAQSSSASLNDLLSENSKTGKSGTIVIQAYDTIRLQNGSSVTVETAQANAGDITVNAGFLVHLRDKSAITTSVAGGKGNGGNIIIDPIFVVMDGASKVIANALKGRGGNITIRIVGDGDFLKSPDSVVDASSEFGVSGSVTIDAPDTDISGSISTLPVSFLDVSSLLSERCVTRTAGELSTFIIVGHGGMPLSPDTPLPAFYLLDKPKDQQDNSLFNKRKEPPPKQTTNKQVFVPFDINGCQ